MRPRVRHRRRVGRGARGERADVKRRERARAARAARRCQGGQVGVGGQGPAGVPLPVTKLRASVDVRVVPHYSGLQIKIRTSYAVPFVRLVMLVRGGLAGTY